MERKPFAEACKQRTVVQRVIFWIGQKLEVSCHIPSQGFNRPSRAFNKSAPWRWQVQAWHVIWVPKQAADISRVNRRLWRQELKSRSGTLYLTVPTGKKGGFCTVETQRKEGRTGTSSHPWTVRASVGLSAFNHCRKHIARHNKLRARIKMWRPSVWFSDTTGALNHWEGSQIFRGLGNLMDFWFWRWSEAMLPDSHAENILS